MSLSDAKVRNAKPKAKPYKITDGEGMFLLVAKTGNKSWRLKYYFAGMEKLLTLGNYPEVTLSEARDRRFKARQELAAGNDPAAIKKDIRRQVVIKLANSFEAVAKEWLEQRKHEWEANTYRIKVRRLEMYVFPLLGQKPVADITAQEVLAMARVVEKSGLLATARRIMQMCAEIFMYSIATGRATRNPVPDLRGALKAPVTKHRKYLKENELPEFFKKLKVCDLHPQTKLALRLLFLTFVRTIELRAAEWTEIDFKKKEWRIPAERMKMGELHIVPLSRQALAVIQELHKLTGTNKYIFKNEHNDQTYMSENTMIYALYRMGYHQRATCHGFRSTASTVLNENNFRSDVIERQLAHGERDKVRAAYNYAQYIPERQKMMQWWADYLTLKEKSKSGKRTKTTI